MARSAVALLLVLASVSAPGTSGREALAWQTLITSNSRRFLTFDSARELVVDANGDVVVVGQLRPPERELDAIVMKLSGADGHPRWRRTIVDLGGGALGALALDGAGSVVVAGHLFTVVKLDAGAGRTLWRQRISGRSEMIGYNEASAVLVDAVGDVIAAGKLKNSDTRFDETDFTVVKLSGASGAELWRHVIAGPCRDEAVTVAADGAGNVVVAGRISTEVNEPDRCTPDFDVVMLANADGSELWRRDLAIEVDSVKQIAFDADGDVVLAGIAGSFPRDLVTAKLSGTDGRVLWLTRIESLAPPHGSFGVAAVRVDASGDVVTGGDFVVRGGPFGTDFIVVKMAGESGAELWRRVIADASASAITLDAAGDVVAGGALGTDLAAVKLSGVTGEIIWSQAVDGTATGAECPPYDETNCYSQDTDHASAVAVDGSGSVVVAGAVWNFRNGTGHSDFAVVKFSDLLEGKRLRLKNKTTPSSGLTLFMVSTDPNILAPAPGSPGDPTAGGASLELFGLTTGNKVSIELPASRWKAKRSGRSGRQIYRYRDRRAALGACRRIVLKSGKLLKVRCRSTGIFARDGTTHGNVGAKLTMGDSGFRYCMLFDRPVQKNRGRQTRVVFTAKNAAAPTACPEEP